MRPIFDEFADEYSAIVTPSAIDVAPLGLEDISVQFSLDRECMFIDPVKS